MLKKSAIRRIMISTVAFIIVSILCFFPAKKELNIESNVQYLDIKKSAIYLLNNDNYVVRTDIVTKNTDSIEKAKELIEALIIDSEKSNYISKDFTPIIPKNTKILNISLENKLLKINFSKSFLDVKKNNEEKLIEALIYTLLEDKNISGIMLFIEGEKLEVLPQSNIKLPNILDKNFGINKVYDITKLKDVSKTTIYYIGKNDNQTYYIPVTKVNNDNKDKIEIIIEELKSSPIYETNLMSYLASNVELLGYEALENQILLSFNQAIFNDLTEKNILEEVKYSIALSLKDTLSIENVVLKVDNKTFDVFNEKK